MAVYRGYCRVSTKDQGLTLITQERKHKDNSIALGLDLVLYIEKESGRTEENRKEFQRLISESEKGDCAGFVDVERFGRDVENNAGTYKILKEKGVMIQVAGIIYDPDSPAHKALFDMQSVFAEYIAESNKQKSKDEMMKMKQNGDWPFSGNLLGYKIIRTGKKSRKVEVYQKEADLVKYIFQRYSEGDIAYLKLAKELEIQGLKNRFGKALAETQVREAINRPIYMGYYILETTGRKREHVLHDLNRDNLVKSNLYSQVIADTQEEAEELWWKCQHIARTTIRVHETHYTARLTAHALSGLIRCDNCKVGTVYANDLKAYTIHYCKCRGYNLKTFKDPFFAKLFEQLFYMAYLFKDSIKEIIDKEKINIESMKMEHQLRIRQIEIEKREIKKEINNLAKAQASGADMGQFIKEKQDLIIEKDELIKIIQQSLSTTQQRVDEIIDEFSDDSIYEFRNGNEKKKKRLYLTHLSGHVYKTQMEIRYNHSDMTASIPLERGMRSPIQFTIKKGGYTYPELSYNDVSDKLEIIGKCNTMKDEVFKTQLKTLGDRINGI